MIGRILSHYRILDRLGEGGMGEVFLAEDTVLHRRIALKVLPPELAARRDRLERFRREATAVAALDHPNIVTVFSVEESEGIHFITMQLVQGKPLSERIPAGGFPLKEFFGISVPLADAIAAAHAQGIVHRDLKPANVMVTDDGRVAVLDFGLAKLEERSAETATASQAATAFVTGNGQIPGTVAYMSPEQAAGEPVDHRSDIFSLAIVLHEMATGKHPFPGKTASAVVSAILRDTPSSVSEVRPSLPRHLGRIIRHGLAKQVDRRYQAVLDLKNDLEELQREVESGELVAGTDFGTAPGRRRRWRTVLGLGALAAAAVVVGWLLLSRTQAPRLPLRSVPLTSWSGSERHPALSPRGDQVAFVWDGGPRRRADLYVMLLGSDQPLRLTEGPGEIGYPAWSPDGLQIAFLRRPPEGGAQVVAIPALGGGERILWASSEGSLHQLDWSRDGKTLAFVEQPGGTEPTRLALLATETGEKRLLATTPIAADSFGDRAPAFSPDGSKLAFLRWYETPRSEIYVQPLTDGETRLLASHEGWIEGLDWMPGSAELVFSSPWQGATGLWRVSLAGEVSQLGFGENAGDLSIAVTGDRLVFAQDLTDSNIWRVSGPAVVEREPPRRLIASTRDDWAPDYSPTGDRIALISNRSGSVQLWLCDGEGQACSHYETAGWTALPSWSPDGSRIAFGQEMGGQFDVFVSDVRGGFPRRLTSTDAQDEAPAWSPDGHWIYYHSRRGDLDQIWRVPAEGGEPERIASAEGNFPAVSADHRHVYYRRPSRPPSIWRAPVAGGPPSLVLERAGLSSRPFELWENSLIYVVHDEGGAAFIERLDLDSGTTERIADLESPRQGRLSVSADGRWILHAQNDARGGDLILIENLTGG